MSTLRVAIIGSGPAGFYTASRILSKLAPQNINIDIFEKLPVPFGLVRYGVAPDHPEVKNVEHKFTDLLNFKSVRFFGNVNIGDNQGHNTIDLNVLKRYYNAIVLAYGASQERNLNVPGENLEGIYSARNFVGWYNGNPDFVNLNPLLDTEKAVIIGQGNVALDIARILLRTDMKVLMKTDITDYALDAISKSRVKKIDVVGRRGPLQVAFTTKEVREMMSLPGVGFLPIQKEETLLTNPILKEKRPLRRLIDVISKGSKTSFDQASKIWGLEFMRSPKEFISKSISGRVSSIRWGINELDEKERVHDTGREIIQDNTHLVFKSVGYRAEPITSIVPFNSQRAILPNDLGKVSDGIYTSGWVKRGPTGVIASTMYDAFETGDRILYDFSNGNIPKSMGVENDIVKELERRHIRYVSMQDWKKIDMVERNRGKEKGKEREKIYRLEDMYAILDGTKII